MVPGMTDDAAPTRRAALARLVTGAITVIGSAFAAVFGVFAANPAARASGARWVRAGVLDDLEPELPHPLTVTVPKVHGWYRARAPRVVFVSWTGEEGEGAVQALSATCSHLGCGVRWDAAAGQFKCPCHGGTYDKQGQVVAGPPPRALERLPVRIETEGETRHVMVAV
jgi:Rieske Fe-S protein